MFEDKTLVCKDCGAEFVFTAGEQEFYEAKGFVNEPQRCKACRDARKNAGRAPRRCTKQFVLIAVELPRFLLHLARIVPYTAVNALLR